MAVTFELPNDLEQQLRRQVNDLSQAAKEFTLVELYRQGRISHADLTRALGLSRVDTEEVLQRHRITEDLPTEEEHNVAMARLRSTK